MMFSKRELNEFNNVKFDPDFLNSKSARKASEQGAEDAIHQLRN